MIPYIALYVPLAALSILAPGRRVHPALWCLAFLSLLVFVGLRHHVGMDWNNYQHMIRKITAFDFFEAIRIIEPLYGALLWASGRMSTGVYGANVVGALICFFGLFRYARRTPSPWAALMIAMPMLIVVIFMSANRQAVAIGILLWLVAGWETTSRPGQLAGILIAALFHTSALFFLIFVVLDAKLALLPKIVTATSFVLLALLVPHMQETFTYYSSTYIREQDQSVISSGALVHTLLNGGPVLLVLTSKQLRQKLFPNSLHRNMALFAIALVPASLVFSTAAGRLSMYLFPVSMFSLSALPFCFEGDATRNFIRFLTAALFLLILVIWLSYSNNGFAYLPYQNLLTTEPFFREWCC